MLNERPTIINDNQYGTDILCMIIYMHPKKYSYSTKVPSKCSILTSAKAAITTSPFQT